MADSQPTLNADVAATEREAHAAIDRELAELKRRCETSLAFEGLERRCAHCGEEAVALLRCGRCKAVKYCSRVCQAAAYKNGHRTSCGAGLPTPAAVRGGPRSSAVRSLAEFGRSHEGVFEACAYRLRVDTKGSDDGAAVSAAVLAAIAGGRETRALSKALGLCLLSDASAAPSAPAIAFATAVLDQRSHRLAVFEALRLLGTFAASDASALVADGVGARALRCIQAFPANGNVQRAAERLLEAIGALRKVDPGEVDAVAAEYAGRAVRAHKTAASRGDDCAVCLAPLRAGTDAIALPCGHEFHRACVARWYAASVKQAAPARQRPRLACPLCKALDGPAETAVADAAAALVARAYPAAPHVLLA